MERQKVGEDLPYEIRALTLDEVRNIYQKYLCIHFPEEERKPLKAIERMWEQGKYFALSMFEKYEKELVGYAFFSGGSQSDIVLLDYFAMLEKQRGTGFGSVFLQQMQDILKERFQGILIETEDVCFAKNEQETKERNRRNDFYIRNGAKRTGITSQIYGARYEVYVLPFEELEKVDEKLLCRICYENLYEIY